MKARSASALDSHEKIRRPFPHGMGHLDMLSFLSQGRLIRMERVEPETPGPHPTVLVLPGADYMEFFSVAYRSMARQLAASGYLVLLVYYFDFTRTTYDHQATPSQQQDIYLRHFGEWMRAIGDAIQYATDQPEVDSNRIGLFGVSLSASLALSVASMTPKVRAIVEYYGKVPAGLVFRIKSLPPTLILHGSADEDVSVTEAYRLKTLLEDCCANYEIHIYPGQQHGFRGIARTDALRRTITFLDKHLKA